MKHRAGQPVTRREALCRMGSGFGMLAFAGLVGESLTTASLLAQSPAHAVDPAVAATGGLHHPARAKHVIFLFMNGGLSQVDSFDYKPMLEKYHGQPLPGGAIATERKTGALMKSPFAFKRYGQCGMEVSELFPLVGAQADDICLIRSMYTDIPNHEPSLLMMNTGHTQVGRPSMGSWLTYGLGTDNRNLPGFVVLCPEMPTTVGPPLWNNAFLPAVHQGTFIQNKAGKKTELVDKDFDPQKLVSYIHNDKFTLPEQRRELDLLASLDNIRDTREEIRDPQLDASIQAMEVAYRMQTEAPEVFDIRKESPATLELYGPGSTARSCLMAVRLIARGVRMAQVYYAAGDPWDAHVDLYSQHRKPAFDSDRPFAAVIKDLKSRGLLKDTIVVCGSEFGRTPVAEIGAGAGGLNAGRDHNPFGFSMWLAGGGIKGGTIYGATDDFGFKVVDKPVNVHDLHATILYLLGIDHTKLTYRYSGRDFRLTDVAGNVIHDIIA
ncbi:MAG TPA: DUF1501 domain-containing protein [Vicinamibacterales bacterium]|nr:DUF1501 domain-containing protein [Vicinamibacterales bacterium]